MAIGFTTQEQLDEYLRRMKAPEGGMQNLIERLENATKPNETLDLDISYAVGTYSGPDRGSYNGNWPKYTASIDAALTLVPKGNSVHAHIFTHYDGAISAVEVGAGKKGQSVVPAIALCIAALKSRAWAASRATLIADHRVNQENDNGN